MNFPSTFLKLQDATDLTTAVFIVIFVTQAVQQLTGINPKWIAAIMSMLTAMLGISALQEQPRWDWYGVLLQTFIRGCQLYCMAAGAVGLTARNTWRKRSLAASPEEQQLRRPFWVRWY